MKKTSKVADYAAIGSKLGAPGVVFTAGSHSSAQYIAHGNERIVSYPSRRVHFLSVLRVAQPPVRTDPGVPKRAMQQVRPQLREFRRRQLFVDLNR